MSKGTVSVVVGGIKRAVRVEMRLALEIEAETGVGTLRLAHDFLNSNGKLVDALAVLRVALAANGMQYSAADMLENAAHEGIPETMKSAARILGELFNKPEARAGKGRVGPSGAATDPNSSH